MSLLNRVRAVLERHDVAHALIGAGALAARGIARSTYDIDLLATDVRVLRDELWNEVRGGGVSVDVRRGDEDDPLLGVVRLEAPPERPVDIIVGRHAWQADAIARAERVPDGPPIVTAPDLILLKLYAGGALDLWDVRELLSLPDGEAFAVRVAADLEHLPRPMRERWDEVRR
jgi:hypothetical protein